MDIVKLNALLFAVLSLAQLVVGALLLLLSPDQFVKGVGAGLLMGGTGTGLATASKTRGSATTGIVLLTVVCAATIACSASARAKGLKVTYVGLSATQAAFDSFDAQKVEAVLGPVKIACASPDDPAPACREAIAAARPRWAAYRDDRERLYAAMLRAWAVWARATRDTKVGLAEVLSAAKDAELLYQIIQRGGDR